jgi:hypothetical protein
MTSKSKYAFVMPDEFAGIVDDCRISLGLILVVENESGVRELWDGTRESLLRASRIFLADKATTSASGLSDPFNPARLGWVLVEVPRLEESRLFCIQIGARGDWFDKDAGVARDNKAALRRFDRVWKAVATRLRFPIRAKNVVTGAAASYSSFGFSAGAAEWWTRGGQLRQRGVENLDFMIPDAQSA